MGESAPAGGDETTPLASPEPAPPGGRSLAQAVVTALILVGLMAVFYLLGVRGFFVLASLVVGTALFELLDALKRTGHDPSMVIGLAGGFAMFGVAYSQRPALFSVVLATVLVLGFLWALRPNRGPVPASDVAWTLLGVAWIGGGGAGAISILVLDPGGLDLLIAFILTVAAGDIGAYFVGTAIGKHKLAPSISPGKSWEGFIGGVVGSLLGGLLFAGLLDELNLLHGAAIGVICGLISPVGDLVESLVKREIGIKDSGRLLPGHGGFLDRLDAILFAAPAIYLYLLFIVF
ncbi:MAG: phosphatidate cytidylyltransferase [Actinomycetota bacterium]|nr:phosphatidate cytidylyltransferase [Actinomycetota bacterium]